MEKTLILFKPDANRRRLIAPILLNILQNQFLISEISVCNATKEMVYEHYKQNLTGDDGTILNRIYEYFSQSPIIAMTLEKENAIKDMRKLIGASDPITADKNSIRGKWSADSYAKAEREGRSCRNLIHATDSASAYKREYNIWFKREES